MGELIERPKGCKCHWEEGDSPCPVHDTPQQRLEELQAERDTPASGEGGSDGR